MPSPQLMTDMYSRAHTALDNLKKSSLNSPKNIHALVDSIKEKLNQSTIGHFPQELGKNLTKVAKNMAADFLGGAASFTLDPYFLAKEGQPTPTTNVPGIGEVKTVGRKTIDYSKDQGEVAGGLRAFSEGIGESAGLLGAASGLTSAAKHVTDKVPEILYHGADAPTAASIRAGGFRPSQAMPGHGMVSLTSDPNVAANYTMGTGEVLPIKVQASNIQTYRSMQDYVRALEAAPGVTAGEKELALNAPYDLVVINGNPALGEKAGQLVLAKPEVLSILDKAASGVNDFVTGLAPEVAKLFSHIKDSVSGKMVPIIKDIQHTGETLTAGKAEAATGSPIEGTQKQYADSWPKKDKKTGLQYLKGKPCQDASGAAGGTMQWINGAGRCMGTWVKNDKGEKVAPSSIEDFGKDSRKSDVSPQNTSGNRTVLSTASEEDPAITISKMFPGYEPGPNESTNFEDRRQYLPGQSPTEKALRDMAGSYKSIESPQPGSPLYLPGPAESSALHGTNAGAAQERPAFGGSVSDPLPSDLKYHSPSTFTAPGQETQESSDKTGALSKFRQQLGDFFLKSLHLLKLSSKKGQVAAAAQVDQSFAQFLETVPSHLQKTIKNDYQVLKKNVLSQSFSVIKKAEKIQELGSKFLDEIRDTPQSTAKSGNFPDTTIPTTQKPPRRFAFRTRSNQILPSLIDYSNNVPLENLSTEKQREATRAGMTVLYKGRPFEIEYSDDRGIKLADPSVDWLKYISTTKPGDPKRLEDLRIPGISLNDGSLLASNNRFDAKSVLPHYVNPKDISVPNAPYNVKEYVDSYGRGKAMILGGEIAFFQRDPQWKISTDVGGCQPTAMANIISKQLGKFVTPDDVANVASKDKMYSRSELLTPERFVPDLSKKYGLTATQTTSLQEAEKLVKKNPTASVLFWAGKRGGQRAIWSLNSWTFSFSRMG